MSEKYQICFVKPPGYEGSLVFREVLFLLRNSLRDLGHTAEIVPNQLSPDHINIIVGYHLLDWGEYLKQVRYIPFQFEQLDSKVGWYSQTAEKILGGAEEIWDYSARNIEFLKGKGLQAKHVLIGYHPDLEVVPESKNKDIDVLFYGSVNDRRTQLMEGLKKECNAQFVAGVFGAERDELIARSKIVLNVHHFYQTQIMEAVRISFLLNNSCFVISEESADHAFPQVDLVTTKFDNIHDTVLDYLENPEAIEKTARMNYRQFRETQSMISILKSVL
jgi:hypothetical protein